MGHLPSLISNLAIILMTAGIITILFKSIKQPVVLGYIWAGIIVGPSLHFFEITNMKEVSTWAEIGVIFLLFALGLEFSFKKLFNIGSVAFITAFTIVIGMVSLGFFTGKMLGWSGINCLFLGGMMAMSSTTIIVKSFNDMGLKSQQFAGMVVGVLIVEDLFAVVLMVLLSTFAISSDFSGGDIVMNILRLFMFILIWFVCGIYLLPTIFKKTRKYLNDETLLILSVALCLMMVLLATNTGFSAALGAFVMGSLLAETIEAERIEHLVSPVKDLFGAVFFVSVGMMIDPMMLLYNWKSILLITIMVMAGQIFFGSMGMIFSGQPLKVAMQSGFSLAQVGEFAFIIAQLGLTLGVTNKDLYPTIVAVSAITTFFTPYLIQSSTSAYEKFSTRLPKRTLRILENLSFTSKLGNSGFRSELIKTILGIIILHSTIIIAIIIFGITYLQPFLYQFVSNEQWANILCATIILICMAPFLRALMVKKNKTIKQYLAENNVNKGALVGLIVVRIFLCLIMVMFVLSHFFHFGWIVVGLIAISFIVFTMLSKKLKRSSILIEKHFLSNLTEREQHFDSKKAIRKDSVNRLLARDIHLAEFVVHPQSPNVGRSLKEIDIRKKYDVQIVSIIRGEMHINVPGGEEFLYPYDKLVVCGTDEQLKRFTLMVEQISHKESNREDVILEQIQIDEHSLLLNQTILSSRLRELYGCMLIGIEREGQTTLGLDINTIFQLGDILLLVGEKQKINELYSLG